MLGVSKASCPEDKTPLPNHPALERLMCFLGCSGIHVRGDVTSFLTAANLSARSISGEKLYC